MTYQEFLELKSKRAEKLAEGKALLAKKDFDGHKALMAEVDKMNLEIDAAEKQLAEEGRFAEEDEKMKGLHQAAVAKREDEAKGRRVDTIRGANEYAAAFAKAMREQVTVKRGREVEALAPLYKALSESGGDPAGADGGFLVPVEFDNQIARLEKEYLDLAQLFNVESVRTPSGWRAVEAGLPKALPKIAEGGTIGREDQPKFRKVTYAVEKYGDRLPVSSELMEDNTAGLLQYLSDWFGPKYILTKNTLLLALLKALTTEAALPAGGEVKALKNALVTKLNTAYSRNAVILTNQNGYAAMDGWEDKNGRPMLVPNPADATVNRFQGRQVVYGDNDLIPDEAGKIPLYIGNFKRVGTLFVRKGIEMAATDVGGDAWVTDSYEIRGLCRLDAQGIVDEAGFKATITASEAAG